MDILYAPSGHSLPQSVVMVRLRKLDDRDTRKLT